MDDHKSRRCLHVNKATRFLQMWVQPRCLQKQSFQICCLDLSSRVTVHVRRRLITPNMKGSRAALWHQHTTEKTSRNLKPISERVVGPGLDLLGTHLSRLGSTLKSHWCFMSASHHRLGFVRKQKQLPSAATRLQEQSFLAGGHICMQMLTQETLLLWSDLL